MGKFYLIVIINFLFLNTQAQNFQWAKREGLYAYDYGYGISTDHDGNIYVAGKYEQEADFSGTILSCVGNHDIFVARYSSTGHLDWIRTAGGVLGDYAHALACDGTSAVYAAGEIEGYGTVISFQGTPTTLTSVGDNDIYLSKYDLSGNLLWAKSAGGYRSDKALGVSYDNSGNVYICGELTDTVFFPDTTIYGNGMADAFIAKYDAAGNFMWVRQAGGPGRDEAKSIECDNEGNIYVCGFYTDTAWFDSTMLTSPMGYYNSFLAKYTTSGTLEWVKPGGGDYDDVAWSLVLDHAGKIYVTGEFNAYALFGSYALTTSGNADIFVACYDTDGNVQWAKSAGGPLIDRARGIGSDGTNVYLTGQFGTSASFDAIPLTGADSSEIFMAKISNTGNFMWATAVGGPPDSLETLGYESGNAITADSSGYVYATGTLLNGGIFGSTSFLPYSRTDIFVTKMSQAGSDISEQNLALSKDVYPNPGTGNFIIDPGLPLNEKVSIVVFNYLGQTITEKKDLPSPVSIDLTGSEKGIYFVEINSGKKTFREKIILQ